MGTDKNRGKKMWVIKLVVEKNNKKRKRKNVKCIKEQCLRMVGENEVLQEKILEGKENTKGVEKSERKNTRKLKGGRRKRRLIGK